MTFGNDTLSGGAGDDQLIGEVFQQLYIGDVTTSAQQAVITFGDDRLVGGTGNDRLVGDVAASQLRVSNSQGDVELIFGADTFAFGTTDGADVIEDFQQGLDIIEIAGGLSFETLDIREEGGNSIIDFAGAAANDHQITVAQVTGLTSEDFIFV